MQLIELDNCFVQPQAILKISAEKIFNADTPNDAEQYHDNFWIQVIEVTLVGDQKRTIRFADEASRDKRFQEILEEMRAA